MLYGHQKPEDNISHTKIQVYWVDQDSKNRIQVTELRERVFYNYKMGFERHGNDYSGAMSSLRENRVLGLVVILKKSCLHNSQLDHCIKYNALQFF